MRLILFLYLSLMLTACIHRGAVVRIENRSLSKSEKEAILIIPGFGSKMFGNRWQDKYFRNKGYDVYIPNYIGRKSIAQCSLHLERFIEKHKLMEYKKVHVLSYIVAAWAFNNYLNAHPQNNIASIVYDRSPLQERADNVLVSDSPFLIRMAAGKIMWDFTNTPYPPVKNDKIKVGILIESKATKLMQHHKKTALKMGEFNWNPESFNQPFNDYFYTWVNHDQMYYRFDVIGEEIFTFFNTGKFSDNAKRTPFDWDHFETYKETDKK